MCPPLRNTMVALSARYLYRDTDLDQYYSTRYYQKCLDTLVPMLNHFSALMDENLFASVVLLRTFEEIEGKDYWLLEGTYQSSGLIGQQFPFTAVTLKPIS